MFAFLRGIVAHKGAGWVALDVNGAGYHVLVPDGVHGRLRTDTEAKLLTYCYIREDAFQIYGFLAEEEPGSRQISHATSAKRRGREGICRRRWSTRSMTSSGVEVPAVRPTA